jgi:hypothetical protein
VVGEEETVSSWVYILSEPGCWTVGFYAPDGSWNAESDHDSRKMARARVSYLNGGERDADDGPEPSFVEGGV